MVDRHYKVLVATMRITTNTTPHTLGDNKVKYWLTNLVVVIAAGKRPASIPNLEAKPASADGTAPGRVWESRTPPQHSSRGGLEHCSNPPSSFLHPPALTYPTTQHIHTRGYHAYTTQHTAVFHTCIHTRAYQAHAHALAHLANTTQTQKRPTP